MTEKRGWDYISDTIRNEIIQDTDINIKIK